MCRRTTKLMSKKVAGCKVVFSELETNRFYHLLRNLKVDFVIVLFISSFYDDFLTSSFIFWDIR